MSSHMSPWTIGVEEEFQIIDPSTRELSSNTQRILSFIETDQQERVDVELLSSQIETATPVCQTLAQVRSAIITERRTIITAAAKANSWIAASGTHPFSHWHDQQITNKVRYRQLEQHYQQLAHEQVILGCHIHIGYRDREQAIQIMNRARIWLAPILALSANSPFWLGDDTGYASYRTLIWARWPMAGPPPHFSSSIEYDELLQMLIQAGTIPDASHIYWDIRLSDRYPTIEFRVTDVCMTVDETVMLAGLVRALAQTCAEQADKHLPYNQAPNELLRAAHWHAARYGFENHLIDSATRTTVTAPKFIENFLQILRPALEESHDWDEISELVHTTLNYGNGAMRQRKIFRQTGHYEDVVDFIVAETAKESEKISYSETH
jgi:glutamate---cysteine ligase / carboxylate-amine ligase